MKNIPKSRYGRNDIGLKYHIKIFECLFLEMPDDVLKVTEQNYLTFITLV